MKTDREGLPWAAHEDEYLTANYRKKKVADLNLVFARSPKAIYGRARRLGLRKKPYTPGASIFCARLYEQRKAAGLTINELAEELGYSRTTISAVERGSYSPSIHLVADLATYFHLDPAWLVGWKLHDNIEQSPKSC